jgi:uncharacterized protein
MSGQTIIILILVGIAAGMLSGLVGIGGGIIIVPALVYFLGFTQKDAQGTSLGILLLPVGLLAVMNYYKQGHINVSYVLLVSVSFLIGGFFGSKISLALPDEKVKRIFAIVLMLVAIKMLFFDRSKPRKQEVSSTTHTEINNS